MANLQSNFYLTPLIEYRDSIREAATVNKGNISASVTREHPPLSVLDNLELEFWLGTALIVYIR